MANLLKWWQTLKISWSNHTAYRLNFVLQVIGPVVIFFLIKYSLWSAIYKDDTEQLIQGYNFQQMITYNIWVLIVQLLAQAQMGWNMANDIRLGRISSYLIYPFNFWEFHTASFLGFQLLQVLVCGITLVVLALTGFMPEITTATLITGFCFSFYVGFFWFTMQYFTGLLAFWLEQTWILRVLLGLVASFLSGAILPLELFPQFMQDLLEYTPFPYLTFYPVKVFMGEAGSVLNATAVVTLWIIIGWCLNIWTWKKGLKMYTAAGM